MKNIVFMAFLALLLVACGHGKTDKLATADNPAESARVFIIRDSAFFGLGMTIKVSMDGEGIAKLRAGRYVSFYAAPGLYTFSVKSSSTRAALAKGLSYYFLVKSNDTDAGFEIGRISESHADPLLKRFKQVD